MNSVNHTKTLNISQEKADYIRTLLSLTGNEIYDLYGLKRDETITETVDFGDGVEMDIKLVICEDEESPYTEAVLFKNGSEITHTDVEYDFEGEWVLEYETDKQTHIYTAVVNVA